MRDFTKKYFHLNSSAVYNSSAKNQELTGNYIPLFYVVSATFLQMEYEKVKQVQESWYLN